MNRSIHCLVLSIGLLTSLLTSCVWAQYPAKFKDIAYDNAHASQKLDVYLPEKPSNDPLPVMIHFHGGGWRAGSKNAVPGWLINGVKDGWLAVVSVEYRFTDVASHPAQVNDCLRSIQYVRAHAKEWNIDPKRIGVTGGSAGGHLSLWVAAHDDIAKRDSEDPVARESSRVKCAISFAGPTDWSLLKDIDHKHPAYRQLIGYEPGTTFEKMDAKSLKDVSPISFVSSDDPPMMQVHGDKDDIVPIEHAQQMQKELEKAGVTNELVIVPNAKHEVAGAGPAVSQKAVEFAKANLKK